MYVDILGYRPWAYDIYKAVKLERPNLAIDYFSKLESLRSHADVTFAVGWSEIIPEDIYSKRPVLILHPSPLPKYRGGSPIQHQLIAGEKVSAVTLFKLDAEHPEIDSGPIAWQMAFSLEGSLNQIFGRIIDLGTKGILNSISLLECKELHFLEQDDTQATVFKRRLPYESEISRDEMTTWPAWKLEAKIRGLADPYPNAFITCADDEVLYITGAKLKCD